MGGIFVLLVSCSPVATGQQERPNIIFIMADDLNDFVRFTDTYKMARTPNLDRLAAQSSVFVNAHSNAPVCAPSRASLFTGIYPHRSGKYGFTNWRKNEVLSNSKTIMEQLRDHGYTTAGVGKLMHSPWKPAWDEYGLKQDYTPIAFDGTKKVGHPSVPEPFRNLGPLDATFAPLSDVPIVEPRGDASGHEGWYSFPYQRTFRYVNEDDRDLLPDEKTADWAMQKLVQWNGDVDFKGPFFLGVGFIRPHTPLVVPDRFFDMFPISGIELPHLLDGDESDCYFEENHLPGESKGRKHYKALMASFDNDELALKTYLQAYLASIAFMDEQVGRIIGKLNDTRFKDNTIVVFTSDHGYTLGEKGYLFKNNLWESATKVPLLIYDPNIGKRHTIEEAVSLIDLYPTFCEYSGAMADNRKNGKGKRTDGRSLVPLTHGKRTKDGYALTVVAGENQGHHFSLRTDQWRYILYGNGREELYDHAVDPWEEWNKAESGEYRTIREKLHKKLRGLIEAGGH
ncbi:MAG: sulfatase [Flavobacteriaceae bacterium]